MQKILDVILDCVFHKIHLEIAYPKISFTLFDSNHKKTLAISDMLQGLECSNVMLVCEREEEH